MSDLRRLQLAAACVSGKLHGGDAAALTAAVSADPEFADELRRQVVMDTLMRVHFGAMEAQPDWEAVKAALVAPQRRRKVLRLAIPLAVAASLAVAVSLHVFTREPADFRVVQTIGRVTVNESLIETGAGSGCRVELCDKSVLLIDANTKVDVSAQGRGAGRLIKHDEGRIYCDVVSRDRPWVVQAGAARVEVIGTRFEVDQLDAGCINVFKGQVRITYGASGVHAHAGRTAKPMVTSVGGFVSVGPLAESDAMLAWTARFGLAPKPILAEARGVKPPAGDPLIDYGTYTVARGVWTIDEDGGDVVVRSEPATGPAVIEFGEASWKTGVISFRFRLTEILRSPPSVGIVCFNRDRSYQAFSSRRGLDRIRKKGYDGWFRMRYRFEVMPSGKMLMRNWDVWPEGARGEGFAWKNSTMRGGAMKIEGVCGIGLTAFDCGVEFRDLKLEEVVPGEKRPSEKDGG
jgi:ferric-dicitrate binding protein FerR (iron transport regulator)